MKQPKLKKLELKYTIQFMGDNYWLFVTTDMGDDIALRAATPTEVILYMILVELKLRE